MSITAREILDAIPLPIQPPQPQSTRNNLPRQGSNEENHQPENDGDVFAHHRNDKDHEMIKEPPKKGSRPRKQGGRVNMEAFDLILAQPTYQGRPVRKRAWQNLSRGQAIDVFSSSDEEVKRSKVSTSRISNLKNVGKNLRSGARVQKEMETLETLTPTRSNRNMSSFFENNASISFPPSCLVVDNLEIGTKEEKQPLPSYLSKRKQTPLQATMEPKKRVYEDLALPEYDWRLPREDLYEDRDVPLPLDLRDFQHTPRVLPTFKAKTENSYFLQLDRYEEQKEKERRAEQRRRQAIKIQAETASLIARFGGLCDEARELMPDLSKDVVLQAVDQMMRKDYNDSLSKGGP